MCRNRQERPIEHPFSLMREMNKKKKSLNIKDFFIGGGSWTRTNDPFDVNEVLYRLSHVTMPLRQE